MSRELTKEDLANVLREAHGARFELVDLATQDGLIANLATTLRAMQALGYTILGPEVREAAGGLVVPRARG